MIIDNIDISDVLNKYRNNKIIILGHENPDVDSIVSGYLLEKILIKEGYDAHFCIPDKTISEDSRRICDKYGLDAREYQKDIKGDKYILLDHNERDVNGEVICIIDHHPTYKNIDIPLYFNKKISSTGLYICIGNETLLDVKDLRLAALSAVVDTASFHSTKGREEDRLWVLDKCSSSGIDYDDLYQTGLYLTTVDDIEKSSLNGLKKYVFSGKKVQSSYIQVLNNKENEQIVLKILDYLKKYLVEEKLDLFVFIVHDMSSFKSTVYKISENEVTTLKYDQYASRGSLIMPSIEKELKKNNR
jgi:inorganic pyrophosphatase/exopolyphosphatase